MEIAPSRPCIILQPDQAAFSDAIAKAGALPLALAPLPKDASFQDPTLSVGLCASLVENTRSLAGKSAVITGQIYTGGLIMEPYGELSFYEGVRRYRTLAKAFADAGARCLLLHGAQSMLQARAAVLGARDCGLPLLCTFELMGEGDSLLGGGDILSAFLVLQELGVAAVGYCSSVTGLMLNALELIAPYRKVPIISMTENLADALEPEDNTALLALRAQGLSQLGVSMLGIMGARLDHLTAAAGSIHSPELPHFPLQEEIWAGNETQVYYLDENIEFSEPIGCGIDMSDDIIETEHDNWGVLCVRIDTPEEGESISENNAHLSRMPVAFLSDCGDALEAALAAYNGRAIIDSRTELPDERLFNLASRYAAVVL